MCDLNNSVISMRNMSFNIRCAEFEAERIDLVFKMIEKYNPDTIGFQEATVKWMKVLKKRLAEKYDYLGCGRDKNLEDEANPIFYRKNRFKLVNGGTKWLSKTPDVAGSKGELSILPRIVTYAVFEEFESKKQLVVANTHLDHMNEEARTIETKVLMNILKGFNKESLPLVLTGDFNSYVNGQPYKIITIENGYADSSVKALKSEMNATFHNYGKAAETIDFIFVTDQNIKVDYYKVCTETFVGADGKTAYPSDHNPVIIDSKVFY